MEALCPGLPHLMEAYPAKLHLFKHLMVVMIQVITTAAAEATVGATVCSMHAQCSACMAASQPDRDSVQKALLDAAESCEAMVTCALNGAESCSLGRLLCKFAAAAHVAQHLQHKLQRFAASDWAFKKQLTAPG